MITKEMFNEWKAHPVTMEVFKEVQDAKDRLMISLSEGASIQYNAEGTHGMTNKMVGQIHGLDQLLKITFDEDNSIEDSTESLGIIEN